MSEEEKETTGEGTPAEQQQPAAPVDATAAAEPAQEQAAAPADTAAAAEPAQEQAAAPADTAPAAEPAQEQAAAPADATAAAEPAQEQAAAPADTAPAAEPAQEQAAAPADATAAAEPAQERAAAGDERGERARAGGGERRRRHFGRRKVCAFCVENVRVIDYKDPAKLRRYLSDRGRIDARRKTGTCAKHQRWLALALKRARHLALLPYTPEHIRTTGMFATRR